MKSNKPSIGKRVARSIAPLLLLAAGGACGGHESGHEPPATSSTAAPAPHVASPPTLAEAKAIVAGSPEFSDYEFTNAAFTLATARNAMSAEQRVAAKELAAAGWVRMRSDGVELTQKARSDRRWLVRANGMVDLVPLASKEVVETTTMGADGAGNPQAEFTWRWIPNEIGSAFRSGPVQKRFSKPHRATATFLRDGANWSVLRIRPADE